MGREHVVIGKQSNRLLLVISLIFIFAGAVIASRWNSWYTILSGAILAVIGSLMNQASVNWVTNKAVKKKWYRIFW